MLINNNPVAVAAIESSITGIFAGFALTIVVLLVERLAGKATDVKYDPTMGKSTVLVFIGTFFTSTLASFMFAVVAGELRSDTARVFVLLLLPGFSFTLSSVLLALGLIHLLAAGFGA